MCFPQRPSTWPPFGSGSDRTKRRRRTAYPASGPRKAGWWSRRRRSSRRRGRSRPTVRRALPGTIRMASAEERPCTRSCRRSDKRHCLLRPRASGTNPPERRPNGYPMHRWHRRTPRRRCRRRRASRPCRGGRSNRLPHRARLRASSLRLRRLEPVATDSSRCLRRSERRLASCTRAGSPHRRTGRLTTRRAEPGSSPSPFVRRRLP